MSRRISSRSRRSYLKNVAGTSILAGGLAGCLGIGGQNASSTSNELHILTWGGQNWDDTWIGGFEEKHDVTLTKEVISANADAVNKIKRNPPGTYDIVRPTQYVIQRGVQEDFLEPLNLQNIPAYEDQVYDNLKLDYFEKDGDTYAVPFLFGATGVLWNKDAVSLDNLPSLDVLWSDDHAGRVSIRDHGPDNTIFTALKNGQDPMNPSDFEKIQSLLGTLTDNVRTYWGSGSEIEQIVKSGEVDLMTCWDGAYRRLESSGHNVGFSGFQEGTQGWVDSWAIPKGSENQELAEKYINYNLTEMAREWFEKINYPIASTATNYTDEEIKRFNLDEKTLESYFFRGTLSDDYLEQINKMWTEVKSS